AAMDRDVLTEDVLITDPQRGRLASIPLVLGALAQHRAVAAEVVAAHGQGTTEAGMALDDAARTGADLPLVDGVVAHLDIAGDPRRRMDQIRQGQAHHQSPPEPAQLRRTSCPPRRVP